MTDVNLLSKAIEDSGCKLNFLAEACGLTYQGFLPKIRGEREFKQSEIMALSRVLNLTQEQMTEIFFAA